MIAQAPTTRGDVVGTWIERDLVHGDGDKYGTPFQLEPFQRMIVAARSQWPTAKQSVALGHATLSRLFAL